MSSGSPLEASKSQSWTPLISDLGACGGSPAWLTGAAARISGGAARGCADEAGAAPLRASAVTVPTRPCWSSTQSSTAALPASETAASRLAASVQLQALAVAQRVDEARGRGGRKRGAGARVAADRMHGAEPGDRLAVEGQRPILGRLLVADVENDGHLRLGGGAGLAIDLQVGAGSASSAEKPNAVQSPMLLQTAVQSLTVFVPAACAAPASASAAAAASSHALHPSAPPSRHASDLRHPHVERHDLRGSWPRRRPSRPARAARSAGGAGARWPRRARGRERSVSVSRATAASAPSSS